jgi:ABC-type branched-subunit amino acid transport system substrate-binding protein
MIPLLLSLLVAFPADAGRKSRVPDVVEDALAYATTDRSKAVQLLETEIESGPKAKFLPVLTLHAGEQQRLSGDLTAARKWFEASLAEDPGGEYADAATLGLTLVEAGNGLTAKGVSELQRIDEKAVLDTQNADRFLLLAVHATREADVSGVNKASKNALRYAKADPAVKARVKGALEKLATGNAPAIVTPGGDGDGSVLDRASTALSKGDRARAKSLAEKALAAAEPESFDALRAEYLIKRADSTAPVNADRIAVLLPMAGKYEAVGRQVQEAFEFGYRAGGGTRKLVFLDTDGTPEGAVAALEDAVLAQGVVGVVGPLLSDNTEAVVQAAAAMEVPLVSLSQANEDNEHDWVFQGVPSVGDQADTLARYVIEEENLKAFAIFAPESSYGQRAAAEFREAVEANGGTIQIETFYDPSAPALMDFAKVLGRKDYEARKAEWWRLKRDTEEAGGNLDNLVLPPIVDYDAIFLPDNARRVPIAAAALAFEEFPIGVFQPKKEEDPMPLLGLSGWNDDSLVGGGGEYVRNSRFTATFYAEEQQGFVSTFKADTGRTPSSLEAATVDAARLLGAATRSDIRTREDLQQALVAASAANAPTGVSGFQPETRRVDTDIRILTIDREGIKPVTRKRTTDSPPE